MLLFAPVLLLSSSSSFFFFALLLEKNARGGGLIFLLLSLFCCRPTILNEEAPNGGDCNIVVDILVALKRAVFIFFADDKRR